MITQGWESGDSNLSPVSLYWSDSSGVWRLNLTIWNSSGTSVTSSFKVYYYYQ
jgi:hypothetical protein